MEAKCLFGLYVPFINSSNAHLVFSKVKQGRKEKQGEKKEEKDREIKEGMNSIPESTF